MSVVSRGMSTHEQDYVFRILRSLSHLAHCGLVSRDTRSHRCGTLTGSRLSHPYKQTACQATRTCMSMRSLTGVDTQGQPVDHLLGPFSSDHDAEKLEALVDRPPATSPRPCRTRFAHLLRAVLVDRELQSLDEGVQDRKRHKTTWSTTTSTIQRTDLSTRPSPVPDRHNLNKARKNILFFNHRKLAEITLDDHSAMGWAPQCQRATQSRHTPAGGLFFSFL